MKVRRVVLGVDSNGKSGVLSDEVARRNSAFKSAPGFEATLLWSTTASSATGSKAPFIDPTIEANFLPASGESRLMLVTFPPDSVMTRANFDAAAFGAEFGQLLPGLAETFEPDAPGMHTTDSIDYDIVLDGEISLELDDGKEVLLKKHDVAVQQGNRHAWRNKSDRPAMMAFVLMGKTRAG
ncbi:hypothetical protein SAMN05518854_101860 [Variovorax sp. YR266]|uniref:cupin domain-containing protein n=1 Tax=Variovorax sp. YR266 TaxID=1884386 RepID=UPI00089C512B|nr:cupin domain-containing protein [Variovorax sp. YR266]SDY35203.1 hypothetical protein SAMN05518854_101860 [Variovorax sp. YR266]